MSHILHLVPVGLSLQDGVTDKNRLRSADSRAALTRAFGAVTAPRRDQPNPARDRINAAVGAGGVVDQKQLFGAVAGVIRGLGSHYDLCAEWQSIKAEIDNPPLDDPGNDGGACVFIATDTADGLWTAMQVAAGEAGRQGNGDVRYVDDPTAAAFRDTTIRPGDMYVCRVPNLDFTTPQEMTDHTWSALGGVGHVVACSALQPRPRPWRVVVHLSGGFKALIPYLLVVAEGINSVFHRTDRVVAGAEPTIHATVLHKDAHGQRVELPIRAFTDLLYEDLLTLADHARAGNVTAVRDSRLFGLFLTTTGDRSDLTVMGTIMVAIP